MPNRKDIKISSRENDRIRSKFMSKLGFEVGPLPTEQQPRIHSYARKTNLDYKRSELNWVRTNGAVYQDKLKYISPSSSPLNSSLVPQFTSNKPRHATALSFATDVKVLPIPSRFEVRII